MNPFAATKRLSTQRLAAIDVGSNSIRLIVADASPDGTYRVIDDEKEVTRLSQSLASTGQLVPEAIERSVDVLCRMKDIAEGHDVSMMKVIATSAVRDASNGEAFIELVRERAGLEVHLISPEEEGRLAHLSVRNAFDLRSFDSVIADLGGGSTEVVFSAGGEVHEIATLPLGAVRLTEQFRDESNASRRLKLMQNHVRRLVRTHIGKTHLSPRVMFGTGGTFTAIANISYHRHTVQTGSSAHPFTIRGYELSRAEVRYLAEWLNEMPLRSRMRIPGLNPDRADIIVAGVVIIRQLMKHLRIDTLRVHDRGIRDGLLMTMIAQSFAKPPELSGSPDRMQSVNQLAHSCEDDIDHSKQVTRLALEIYDQLLPQLHAIDEPWAQPECRELLRAAAMLHDIGHSINYSRHHKHSYHLIVHSDMPGFTHRELEVIANIARYHRRAMPKLKHPAYEKLSPDDRSIVSHLSAILRIADGLDRAHARFVNHVTVSVRGGTALFTVHAPVEPVVDIWGAARKSQLFHKVFELDPRLEWAGLDNDNDHEPSEVES